MHEWLESVVQHLKDGKAKMRMKLNFRKRDTISGLEAIIALIKVLRVLCCSSKEDLFLIETEFFSFDRTIKLSREVTYTFWTLRGGM